MKPLGVVLVSSEKSIQHTRNAIKSLSETGFNISNVKLVNGDKYKPFNYNKALNFGMKITSSDYVLLCNNDLLFESNFDSELIKAMEKGLHSCSPICPKSHKGYNINPNTGYIYGNQTRKLVAGWAICIRRSFWEKIGGFDEDFNFWCADNSYTEQLIQNNGKHALVTSAIVHHVESQTLKTLDKKTKNDFTYGNVSKFRKKYGKKLF